MGTDNYGTRSSFSTAIANSELETRDYKTNLYALISFDLIKSSH